MNVELVRRSRIKSAKRRSMLYKNIAGRYELQMPTLAERERLAQQTTRTSLASSPWMEAGADTVRPLMRLTDASYRWIQGRARRLTSVPTCNHR